jgi:hypothetical protein
VSAVADSVNNQAGDFSAESSTGTNREIPQGKLLRLPE